MLQPVKAGVNFRFIAKNGLIETSIRLTNHSGHGNFSILPFASHGTTFGHIPVFNFVCCDDGDAHWRPCASGLAAAQTAANANANPGLIVLDRPFSILIFRIKFCDPLYFFNDKIDGATEPTAKGLMRICRINPQGGVWLRVFDGALCPWRQKQ